MDLFLNVIGFITVGGTVMVVLRTLAVWRGPLRNGLFFLALGLLIFTVGFAGNIFAELAVFPRSDLFFFPLGSAFMLLGVKKTFVFQAGSR